MTFPGLGDCQEAYSPYPNALLSLRFIISVGKIIMADSQVEPGEVKEGDNMTMSKPRTPLSRPSAVSVCMKKLLLIKDQIVLLIVILKICPLFMHLHDFGQAWILVKRMISVHAIFLYMFEVVCFGIYFQPIYFVHAFNLFFIVQC